MAPTIQQVGVFPVRLPVLRTFSFASGSAGMAGDTASNVFVKIVDSEGNSGWGEGRPVPRWSYETLETVASTIRYHLAPAIIGLPVSDRWALHRRMHAAIGRGPSTGQPIAKAAVDMDVLEQPLPADQLWQMQALRQSTSLPLAVDEASVSPADFAVHLDEQPGIGVAPDGGALRSLVRLA